MRSRGQRYACWALVFGLSLLASCAKPDGGRLLGHWRSESFKVNSLNLPIAPDIVIEPQALTATASGLKVPIESRSESGDEVVLGFPGGIGLSFFLQSADRMYVDVPLLGKVYYQRVPTPVAVAVGTSVRVATRAGPVASASAAERPVDLTAQAVRSARPAAAAAEILDAAELMRRADEQVSADQLNEARATLLQVKALGGVQTRVDYKLAVVTSRQADADGALRHLGNALAGGFQSFELLDGDPDLLWLQTDVRYAALMSRYRAR